MATVKKTWRDKATKTAITTKINRKKNPASSFAQLAQEFGAPVSTGFWSNGGPAASSSFRTHVRNTLGRNKVFA